MLKRKVEFFKRNHTAIVDYHSVEVNLDIEFEEYYTAASGNSTIIPMNSNWKLVFICLSGGLDSALLLYLISKTIKDRNLNVKIQPFSIEVPTKVKSFESSRAVIFKIKKLLDVDFINDPIEIIMPMEAAVNLDKKNKFFHDNVDRLKKEISFDFEYNGNTKNPDKDIRKNFINDEWRMQDRDIRTTIYKGLWSSSPHCFMDKHDIINLYIKYDLLEELAPLTLSCDQNINEIVKHDMDVPCNRCWWCDERKYGFESNNLDYNRYSPKNFYFSKLLKKDE